MKPETPVAPLPAANPSPELLALPAPRHLHEYLVRSQHLHFGYFENPADSLAVAQERLIQRSARLLPRNSLVADVGCGLGGTVNLLAAQGHRVFGFDPCARSIAYARSRSASTKAQLFACDLEEFARRARGARFDALILCEVLAQFPDLGSVFAHCRALLRPGGLLLVHDLVHSLPRSPAGAAAHAHGALRSAADAAGFDLLEGRDVSARTSPTLPRLLRLLDEKRAEIVAAFQPGRPAIQAELEAYAAQLRALELSFARQEVGFQSSILRCSARLSSDSVVLRAAPRPEPARLRRAPEARP